MPNPLQRSSTFNSNSKAQLPEYKEVPDIKARPFKQKVGFFVKKSNKVLTVPIEPKLGNQKRKQTMNCESYGGEMFNNIDSADISVGLPQSRRISQKPKTNSSKARNFSENASTNASKSRANSANKKSFISPTPSQKQV